MTILDAQIESAGGEITAQGKVAGLRYPGLPTDAGHAAAQRPANDAAAALCGR